MWDPETWPAEAKGVGLSEAPRSALAHWIVIKDKKIDNFLSAFLYREAIEVLKVDILQARSKPMESISSVSSPTSI